MTELEKIERAKMYMDKLANGINPIDDTMAPDDDLINNVRLSGCGTDRGQPDDFGRVAGPLADGL